MKSILICCGLLLLMAGSDLGLQQRQSDNCGFSVRGESAQPVVAGLGDVAGLAHVVEQPDSPIEIVSVDLQGTTVSLSEEANTALYKMQTCASYQVRNRSDRSIKTFDLELLLTSGDGGGTHRARSTSPLGPGQTAEIKACPGLLTGTAPRPTHLSLLFYVQSVDFGACFYRPSLRIPESLGVIPAW